LVQLSITESLYEGTERFGHWTSNAASKVRGVAYWTVEASCPWKQTLLVPS